VRHAQSDRSATYAELAAVAATMPVPDAASVALKPKSAFRLLGTRVTGVDNEKIVRGAPLFGIDQQVPGMVYATYAKAPAIGARAVSANLDEIRELPGVTDAFILAQLGNPVFFDPEGARLNG
jgi:isoquinoline 1-oxidoreductase beta subunit